MRGEGIEKRLSSMTVCGVRLGIRTFLNCSANSTPSEVALMSPMLLSTGIKERSLFAKCFREKKECNITIVGLGKLEVV